MAYHALGDTGESNKAVQALIGAAADNDRILIAQVLAFMGENDEAFKWIALGIENDSWRIVELNTSILLSNLYDDPRWITLLEKLGKSPMQLAAIEFEVSLPK